MGLSAEQTRARDVTYARASMRPSLRSLVFLGPLSLLAACASPTAPADSANPQDASSEVSPADAPSADAPAADAPSVDSPSVDASAGDAALGSDAAVEAGAATPITTPDRTWTFVPFADSVCDDGTPTGLGVSLSSASNNVLLFFNGGGGCWDALTCLTLNTATHGPFQQAQFDALAAGLNGAGTGFSRTNTQNPYRDYSFVYIPYCTGDLHAGSRTAMYSASGGAPRPYYHRGRDNVVAYLRRLLATFPSPGRVVVSGSSAGGYGALLNYDLLRRAWPSARMQLVDDSGPALDDMAVSAALRTAWESAWNLSAVVDPLCGTACRDDLSLAYTTLAMRYPQDRIALLSSAQDSVIRSYLMLTGPNFQTALERTFAARFDAAGAPATLRYFEVTGSTHTMLGNPGSFTSGGQALWDWLRAMATDDPSWTTRHP